MSEEQLDVNSYLNIIISSNEKLKTHIFEFIKQNYKHDIFLNLINDDNIKNTIDTIVDFSRISNLLIDECIHIINIVDENTKEIINKIYENYNIKKNFNIRYKIKSILIEDINNKKFDKKKANIIGVETYNYFLLKKYFKEKKQLIKDEFNLDDLIEYDYTQFNLEDYYPYENFDIFEIDNLNQDNIKDNYQKSTIFDVLEEEAQEESERFINSDNKKIIRLESPNSITHPFVF